jgi:ABC-type transporter Mla maintaining outer membrane lipid asymmetry ATPase subunit MlaF
VVALVGGSGSGKTTLLRQLVIGLLQPDPGRASELFGEPLFGGSIERQRTHPATAALVCCSSMAHCFPPSTYSTTLPSRCAS